jgi:hypothetical protein
MKGKWPMRKTIKTNYQLLTLLCFLLIPGSWYCGATPNAESAETKSGNSEPQTSAGNDGIAYSKSVDSTGSGTRSPDTQGKKSLKDTKNSCNCSISLVDPGTSNAEGVNGAPSSCCHLNSDNIAKKLEVAGSPLSKDLRERLKTVEAEYEKSLENFAKVHKNISDEYHEYYLVGKEKKSEKNKGKLPCSDIPSATTRCLAGIRKQLTEFSKGLAEIRLQSPILVSVDDQMSDTLCVKVLPHFLELTKNRLGKTDSVGSFGKKDKKNPYVQVDSIVDILTATTNTIQNNTSQTSYLELEGNVWAALDELLNLVKYAKTATEDGQKNSQSPDTIYTTAISKIDKEISALKTDTDLIEMLKKVNNIIKEYDNIAGLAKRSTSPDIDLSGVPTMLKKYTLETILKNYKNVYEYSNESLEKKKTRITNAIANLGNNKQIKLAEEKNAVEHILKARNAIIDAIILYIKKVCSALTGALSAITTTAAPEAIVKELGDNIPVNCTPPVERSKAKKLNTENRTAAGTGMTEPIRARCFGHWDIARKLPPIISPEAIGELMKMCDEWKTTAEKT